MKNITIKTTGEITAKNLYRTGGKTPKFNLIFGYEAPPIE